MPCSFATKVETEPLLFKTFHDGLADRLFRGVIETPRCLQQVFFLQTGGCAEMKSATRLFGSCTPVQACTTYSGKLVCGAFECSHAAYLNRLPVVTIPHEETSVYVACDELVFRVDALGHALERPRSRPKKARGRTVQKLLSSFFSSNNRALRDDKGIRRIRPVLTASAELRGRRRRNERVSGGGGACVFYCARPGSSKQRSPHMQRSVCGGMVTVIRVERGDLFFQTTNI